MKSKYKGSISYKINEDHIDYKPNYKDVVFVFEDIYYIDRERFYSDEEEINSYIKNDLRIVAGGGYGTKGIYETFIYIKKI